MNHFQRAVAEGRIPVGHMISEFPTRGMAPMLAAAGLDFVMVDMEHSSFSLPQVADLFAWFRATPVAPFVRVPQLQYHFIARVLDAGAAGVILPDVKSSAEATAFVAAAKYRPAGSRGIFLGGSNTGYRDVDAVTFMAEANANTTLICQIESRAGVENCEAIAATPGVDVLWIGHHDLSRSLDVPGKFESPEFTAAFRRVAGVAQAHGRRLGIQPRTMAQAGLFRRLGANVFSYSADLHVYADALKAGVAELRTRVLAAQGT